MKEGKDTGLTISLRTHPTLQKDDIQKLSKKLNIKIKYLGTEKEYTLLNIASDDDISSLSRELIVSGVLLYEIKVKQKSLEEVFINT